MRPGGRSSSTGPVPRRGPRERRRATLDAPRAQGQAPCAKNADATLEPQAISVLRCGQGPSLSLPWTDAKGQLLASSRAGEGATEGTRLTRVGATERLAFGFGDSKMRCRRRQVSLRYLQWLLGSVDEGDARPLFPSAAGLLKEEA